MAIRDRSQQHPERDSTEKLIKSDDLLPVLLFLISRAPSDLRFAIYGRLPTP
jgi:hypothetical protein